MKVLLAEDDLISRRLLTRALAEWGYEPVVTADGLEAWGHLQAEGAPKLAVLDWGMPGLDGPQVCRRVRERQTAEPTYLLLLTGRDAKADIVAGLGAGANDYVTKPLDRRGLPPGRLPWVHRPPPRSQRAPAVGAAPGRAGAPLGPDRGHGLHLRQRASPPRSWRGCSCRSTGWGPSSRGSRGAAWGWR